MKKKISLLAIAVMLLLVILELNGIDVENLSFNTIKELIIDEAINL